MQFALFILLNAVLFVRPADLLPELEKASIYEAVILLCLAASAPALLAQLAPARLGRRPLTVAVLGLLGAVVLSQLARGSLGETLTQGTMFLKIVLYYLLLVAVVDTPGKLRRFLGWVAGFVLVVTALSLLQHHEVINLPALAAIQQGEFDPETGEYFTFPRLCGTGIFNDPNDLSVILVVGMMICLSRLGEPGGARFLWLGPLLVMGYALTLTQSRGGLLALFAALASLFVGRFGVRKAVLLGAPVLVGVLVLFGGRQTRLDLDNQDDTGLHRIKLWRDGLVLLKSSPVFGIGAGRYAEECGLVAHNSFIHAYTELGVVGGALFLMGFVTPLTALHRFGRRAAHLDPTLRALRPCVMACVAGMAGGMISLSRVYTLTPYLILGVATVYLGLAAATDPAAVPRFTPRLFTRWLFFGGAFVVCADVFVRAIVS
jgi:O-antigen ligase